MESGFATPLLEFFKHGEVAADVKLLAAQGALAPRAHEQLGLLVLLVRDPDPEIASTAEKTLQAISREAIAAFLARSDAPSELKTFFATRGIEPGAAALDNEEALIDTSPKTDDVDDDKDDEGTALQRLQKMNVPQKVQRATKGSRGTGHLQNLLEQDDQQTEHFRQNRDAFEQEERQVRGARDLCGRAGLARNAFRRSGGQLADAEAGADDGESESDSSAGICQSHGCRLCFLHSSLL